MRDLIRRMSRANPLWGAPRIHGELLKLGIEVSQATVSKYMVRHRKPPSQSWRTFLKNHAKDIVIRGFLHRPHGDIPRVVRLPCSVKRTTDESPFQRDGIADCGLDRSADRGGVSVGHGPRYLLRDRDGIFGDEFTHRVESMGIEQVLISARSPWQNPYVERLIGSIRRECLDHTIIFNEKHLRRVLKEYFRYYHESRTHLGLEKDCPQSRPIEPPELGPIERRADGWRTASSVFPTSCLILRASLGSSLSRGSFCPDSRRIPH